MGLFRSLIEPLLYYFVEPRSEGTCVENLVDLEKQFGRIIGRNFLPGGQNAEADTGSQFRAEPFKKPP